MNPRKIITSLILTSTALLGGCASQSWNSKIIHELPFLGHRNWIVVADSAYPLQTSPGIETICATDDQLEVVKQILADLTSTRHVKPIIYTDAELKFVAEKNAPGISAYRNRLATVLGDNSVRVLSHEQIIAKLDEAGKSFKIVIVKTPLTLPYTSVFFQLDCAYWNSGAEKELRNAMVLAR